MRSPKAWTLTPTAGSSVGLEGSYSFKVEGLGFRVQGLGFVV